MLTSLQLGHIFTARKSARLTDSIQATLYQDNASTALRIKLKMLRNVWGRGKFT